MFYIKIFLLSIIQGISEFLPISSSGHITLFQKILDFSHNQFFYNIIFHFGTLFAVLFFFRKKIFYLLKNFMIELKESEFSIFQKLNSFDINPSSKTVLKICIGILPTAIVGFLLKDKIKFFFLGENFLVLGTCFVLMGIYLWGSRKAGEISLKDIGYKKIFFIALAQTVALLPGISRSGVTITTGLWLGMKREDAFTFSFFIGIPLFGGAFLLEIIEMITSETLIPYLQEEIIGLVIALVFSFLSGYVALKILHKLTISGKLYFFSFYLVLLGITLSIIHLITK